MLEGSPDSIGAGGAGTLGIQDLLVVTLPQHWCPVCQATHDVDQHTGKCHVCGGWDRPISYCPECGHWMCPICRGDLFKRGVSAGAQFIKDFLGLAKEGCCGPLDGPIEGIAHDTD